jgi:hypothetical protein
VTLHIEISDLVGGHDTSRLGESLKALDCVESLEALIQYIWIPYLVDGPNTTYLIESLEVLNWRRHHVVVRELVFQVSDEHTKLCAPVPNVINPQNIMADPFQQTANTLTNYCGSVNSEDKM